MSVEDLPSLRPPQFGDVCDPGRPILSYPWRSEGPHRVSSHRHVRGHVLHLEEGAYWVVTSEGRWLAAAGQAFWIPPHTEHEVFSQGPVAAKVLFVDESQGALLPSRCGTMRVTPLLIELFQRVLEYGNGYESDGPGARVAMVLLDELARTEPIPMMLPISKEPRLARAMRCIIDEPREQSGIETVAKQSGASPRTLARLFVRETGMTFTQWRTRLILVEAIDRLARGAAVTDVAISNGYSPSSFSYMFRSNLGVAPGDYAHRRKG